MNLELPSDLRYLLIEAGQKHNPTFPPNEGYSFNVLIFEPLLKIASSFIDISPRMNVLPCILGANYGTANRNSFSSPRLSSSNFSLNKNSKFDNFEKINLVLKVPFQKVLDSVPETAEIFVRADEENLSLEDSRIIGEKFKRITLFKKRITTEKVYGLNKKPKSENNDVSEEEKWEELMQKLGFILIKVDATEQGKEIVWVNPNPKFKGKENSETFLLQSLEDQKALKVKNYIKLSFKTLFFKTDVVTILKEPKKFSIIKKDNALWELVHPIKPEFQENVFKVSKTVSPGENTDEYLAVVHTFFKGGLHCGQSFSKKPGDAIFCWSQYQFISNSFQVLCGKFFDWKPSTGLEIPAGAVVAGRENTGQELYAARVESKGVYFIGKVCADWKILDGEEKRLKCQYYDEKTIFTDKFDVLVYTGKFD